MKFKVKWSGPKKFENENFDVRGEGLYLIGYRDTNTGQRHPVYFGQGAISNRLADHLGNNPCIQRSLAANGRVGYYRYAICGEELDRLDIELGLYRKYGGSKKLCNELEPPGSGRYKTIDVDEEFA